MADDLLTDKQYAFVEAYLGEAECNGVKAARIAGYSGNYNTLGTSSSRMLQLPKIKAAIAKRRNRSGSRMRVKQLKEWWQAIMVDEEADLKSRVKCSELLGRSLGAFVERTRHEHQHLHVAALTDSQLAKLAARGIREGVERKRLKEAEQAVVVDVVEVTGVTEESEGGDEF